MNKWLPFQQNDDDDDEKTILQQHERKTRGGRSGGKKQTSNPIRSIFPFSSTWRHTWMMMTESIRRHHRKKRTRKSNIQGMTFSLHHPSPLSVHAVFCCSSSSISSTAQQVSGSNSVSLSANLSRIQSATPFDHPNPVWTGYSPPPPGAPSLDTLYFSYIRPSSNPPEPSLVSNHPQYIL